MSGLRISVIVPTYNRGRILRDAIDSIRRQTRPADEIIVVDDGSTDDTMSRLATFGAGVQVIRQANAGVSAARNAGVSRASGDWVAFLDSDDVWHRERLAILHRDLAATPEVGVHVANLRITGPGYDSDFFSLRRIEAPRSRCRIERLPLSLAQSGIFCQSAAVRRDWFLKTGGFDQVMRIHEDTHLFCRLALLGPWGLTSMQVANVRRVAGDQIALSGLANTKAQYAAEMRLKVFADLVARRDLNSSEQSIADRAHSGALLDLARIAAANRNASKARRLLIRSAKCHPTLKGWVKAALAFGLGQHGYELLLGRQGEFLRTRG